jgi:sugar (pentulose or hexulose) kinase
LEKACFIGVDLGTSGCRAVAIDRDRRQLAETRTALPKPLRVGDSGVEQEPRMWWDAAVKVLRELTAGLPMLDPQALCVDATSATLLLCGQDGTPLGPALMYNDGRSRTEAEQIARVAPARSPARGAGSSLAKLLHLGNRLSPRPGTLALHQADWILGRLSGRFGISDWNNCLKLGYDPQTGRWPEWLSEVGLGPIGLPEVTAPGGYIGRLSKTAAQATGLPLHTRVLAGTTDSTAAVVATGAMTPGEAITCLGSTLVLKVIGREPVTAPEYGVYSHRYGARWLIGGASNSGGAVLRRYFDDRQMRRLSLDLRPDEPTGLDYYPPPAPGERFPINDSALPPRLSPRPADDRLFFQGLLEGIARIEAAGYSRLRSLGAPAPKMVLTTGGGADNQAWSRIRARLLGVPVSRSRHQEAAYGAALIALAGGVPEGVETAARQASKNESQRRDA